MPVMSSVPLADGGPAFYPLAVMTGGSGKSGNARRAERLKAALRDNLKRRKAQLKARAQAAAQSERGEKAEPEPRKDKGG